MKKKLLAMLLACAALFTAGCGSIGSDSPHWIDSSIKGNVTGDTVVSLKDDFAAAANQDLYASGESEGRTIVNISRTVTERKRALLTDASVTGKGIEEVRKFAALAEDHDGRQALGVTPLEPYLRSIENIASVEELYAWIADPAANPLGASPVEVAGPGRSQVAPSSYFVLKDWVARPRPFETLEVYRQYWQTVGAPAEDGFSFPSGHVTAATAGLTGLCLIDRRRRPRWIVLTVIWVLLMAASRNYLMAHYPSDVLFAVLVGLISALIARAITRLIFQLLEDYDDVPFCAWVLNFDIRNPFNYDPDAKPDTGYKGKH